MNIYLASSWRNARQPSVLAALRAAGHDVYDFRNPAPGDNGFSWVECDPRPPAEWSVADYREVLRSPAAARGFAFDMDALRACDACVLVLPCGRSAHLELGWAAGAGKRTVVLCEDLDEPELMYLMCEGIAATVEEVILMLETTREMNAALKEEMARAEKAEQALREILIGKVRADYEHPMGEWASMAARFLNIARAALEHKP